jgi:hypothetical protein
MTPLLASVIAEPDRDEPRLAYAAAIRADDPQRSRFIELQLACAAAAAPAPELTYGAADLVKAHGHAWHADMCPPCKAVHYHRGFVEHVALSMADFLAHGERLLRQAPIRHLDLEWSPGMTQALFASPLLATIRSISLDRCQLDDQAMAWLAASPYLPNLEWLELMRNHIGMPGVRALAGATGLPRLRYVGFFGNPADPTEELFYDQGIVIDRGLPEQGARIEAEFGPVPWLHLDAVTSWDVPPRRY